MNKTYMDADNDEYTDLCQVESAGKAKRYFADETGEDFTDIHVRRVPWLDEFDIDNETPDMRMAAIRHGWWTNSDGFSEKQWKAFADAGLRDEDGEILSSWSMRVEPDTESDYQKIAEIIGATYPDKYRPKGDQ